MTLSAGDPILFEIDPDRPDAAIVEEAGRRMRAGGVIAHPADTVYGLAAAARHAGAVARMRALKGLSTDRPLIVLIDEPVRIDGLTHSIHRYVVDYIATFWPGPLTLILNARPDTPCRTPEGSIALRCPAQPLTRALIAQCAGLVASTSANRAGEPVLRSGHEIARHFEADGLAMILADSREKKWLDEKSNPAAVQVGKDLDSGETVTSAIASTIIDCRGESPVLIREGPVKARELKLAP